MSIRSCSPNFIMPAKRTTRSLTRVFMLRTGKVQIKRWPALNLVNKVFEIDDQQIVCYTDEKGEVICEGYDEGPRLTWQSSDTINDEREIEIPDAQRGRRLRVAEDGNNHCAKGVAQMISLDVLMN